MLEQPSTPGTTIVQNCRHSQVIGRQAIVSMLKQTVLRVARPTDHLEEVIRFYTEGVGLMVLGSFENHEGFDGVMLGIPGAAYHLEITRKHGHHAGRAPTQDNLLVFYVDDRQEWLRVTQRI